jgi:hypothetical protein
MSWSDKAILSGIESVANDPGSIILPARLGRQMIIGYCKGVRIKVIVSPATWSVITGFPF